MPKNKQWQVDPKPLLTNACFSFARSLSKCGETKNKNYFFTNQVPNSEIREYRATIDNALYHWSIKTIQELKNDNDCCPVKKEKVSETRNNISKVFQAAKYPAEWIEQTIKDADVYKFKIGKQIRIFGIVERNVIYILLYDIWHLINKAKWKNFPIPDNRVCTWCLKSCEGKR